MRSKALFVDHVGELGGAELALVDIATAYKDTSTFLLFADGPFRERLGAQGVKVAVLESSASLNAIRRESKWPGFRAILETLRLAWRVSRLAKDHDFLHANSQKAFVVACLAGVLARKPVIWDLNDLLTPEHFSELNIKLDVLLANHLAVLVIANSQASADALVHRGGVPERIRVVYNGIDPRPFDQVTDQQVSDLHGQLGLNGDPIVGVFGRLTEWKGQHIALEAIAKIPKVHLLLVGDALFGEKGYRERLEAQADRLGVRDRVHFLGFRDDIPELMRLVRIVLHTSTSAEPFGRVIVEGMLAGKPVIATRAGGVAEIIDHSTTGLLVSPGSAEELQAALSDLLGNPARAEQIAQAGNKAAREKFTVAANVDALTAHMETVARR